MDEQTLQIQHCMYQYSRAIYRSIKDLIDPYVDASTQLEYRRDVLAACEGRWASRGRPALLREAGPDAFPGHSPVLPDHGAGPGGLGGERGRRAAVEFIEEQIEAGTFEGGVAHCHATTRKGKPCQRAAPERDYCPSHQHLERSRVAADLRTGRVPADRRG
jgi:hypothetical protein